MARAPIWRKLGHVLAAFLAFLLLTTCTGSSNIQAPGKPYHHLENGRFRNLPGSAESTATAARMMRFFYNRLTDSAPDVPDGHVITPRVAMAQLAQHGNPSVTWLGHAAFLLRLSGKNILLDPYLTETAGPLSFGPKRYAGPGIAVKDLPPIDVIVISHNHYDHLDINTIAALPNKEHTTIVVPLKLAAFFADDDFKKVIELDWFQSADVDDLKITALPAYHFSRRTLFDRDATLWASFAIEGQGYNLWHSGDTAYGPVFSEVGERYGPFDFAMIAIGAYEPAAIMRSAHVTPEEAVIVAQDIRAKATVGMHWGTVKLTSEPPFEPGPRFLAAARAAGLTPDEAFVMKIGETRSLP